MYIQTATIIREKILERISDFFDRSEFSNLQPILGSRILNEELDDIPWYFWILQLRNGTSVLYSRGEIYIINHRISFLVYSEEDYNEDGVEYEFHFKKNPNSDDGIEILRGYKGYYVLAEEVSEEEKDFFDLVEVKE